MLSHPDYNVTTLIDQTTMAMLKSQSSRVHCKVLHHLGQMPIFLQLKGHQNCQRSPLQFLMNLLNDVHITPYKDAQRSSSSAANLELLLLAEYLVSIATSDDHLGHNSLLHGP